MKGLVFTFNKRLKKEKIKSKKSTQSIDFKYLIKHYGSVFFFTFMLILGLAFGSIFYNKITDNALSKLDIFFVTNISERMENGFFGAFCASFASNFLFLLSAFLMGFALWGMAFLPFIILFKGFGVGISAGYLFTSFGFKGAIFYLVILLPGIFLFSMALVYQCATSLSLNKRLVKKLYSADSFSFKSPTMLYLQHSFKYLLISLFSAIIDMALWGLFGGLFNFS